MESLYNSQVLNAVVDRINKLTPETKPLWGKMNVSQMMEHCSRALDFSTGKTFPKRSLLGILLGGFFKASYYNDTPWKHNTPTSPDYVIPNTPAFEQTKQRLLGLVIEFGEGGPEKCTTHPSAFFGKLTPEQHGLGQYKHIDHHLAQFGV